MTSPGDGYRSDLAYIHDVGFGDFATRAAPGLLEILRRGGVASGLVVDLGCGSGIWVRALRDAGYDALGVDISAEMIALAKARAPGATFRVGSFLDAELPECAAVTSIGECFNYLFDDSNGEASLRRLFRRVHRALRPGGLFVFDVAEPGRGQCKDGPRKSFFEGDDWAVLVEFEEDAEARRLERRITSFRRVGELYRRSEEVHRQRLYRGVELAEDLRRAGFRTRVLRGYGGFRLPFGNVALVARKP